MYTGFVFTAIFLNRSICLSGPIPHVGPLVLVFELTMSTLTPMLVEYRGAHTL